MVNKELLRGLEELKGEDLRGALVIVEIGHIRLRRQGAAGHVQ